MISRERFHETLRYGRPDRVPYFEEGLRDDVLAAWQTQGLAPGVSVYDLFETDKRERVPVSLEPIPRLENWEPTAEMLKHLRRHLDPNDPRRWPEDWDEKVRAWRDREHVLELMLHRGFFLTMQVGSWTAFLRTLYALTDTPDLVHEIFDMAADFALAVMDRVLSEVQVDFISFSEPIGGNDGPLLSPDQYDDFVLSRHGPIVRAAREQGVDWSCWITYANGRPLLPRVVNAGFNMLWAYEAPAAMDYHEIRRTFGRELRLMGGIDVDALLGCEDDIASEIRTRIPPLLRDGGFIPLADGRVRAHVPWSRYRFYRAFLERTCTGTGQSEEPRGRSR